MKKTIITLAIMTLTIGVYASEKASLSFFLGNVFITSKDKKTANAKIGMNLSPDDTITTKDNSQAEIKFRGKTYYISEGKTVHIAKLTSAGKTPAAFSAIKRIRDRGFRTNVITSTAAIRAEKEEEEMNWAKDDDIKFKPALFDKENLEKTARLIEEKKYSEALAFAKNISVSSGAKERLKYLEAIASYNLSNTDNAVRTLSSLTRNAADSKIRTEALFHLGLCYHYMGQYNKSNPWLSSYLNQTKPGIYTVQAKFIRGINWFYLKQKKKAVQDLESIINTYSSDPLAKDAENVLAEIE